MSSTARDTRFSLPGGLELAALEWHRDGPRRVIALHGWLDNAGSFDLLAPHLTGCHVVALDSAGHGLSSFRSADATYYVWEEVGEVLDVADQMGWERFTLLGHSRGAGIATLLAGAVPERVERLILIEGGLPIAGSAADAPGTLAKALAERRELRLRKGRVFADRRTAITERAEALWKISPSAAEILARRSLREVPGGYQWHADPRLKGTSPLRLTPEQIEAFVRRVTAPVLMFMAEESPFRDWSRSHRIIRLFRELQFERLPGGHHLHMEGAEERIGARIRAFLDLESAP